MATHSQSAVCALFRGLFRNESLVFNIIIIIPTSIISNNSSKLIKKNKQIHTLNFILTSPAWNHLICQLESM